MKETECWCIPYLYAQLIRRIKSARIRQHREDSESPPSFQNGGIIIQYDNMREDFIIKCIDTYTIVYI